MRLEERRIIDDLLSAEEQCLGAAFCSYTFDPAYFEDHVLRSLLRLSGDPGEDAARYHDEAQRALQATPVACIVDASVRTAGRRLPYDVHLVRRRTFHPKVFLVLFESEARLAVGSGNLTKSGLEQNTELFFMQRLRYDDAAAAALLRDVNEFLSECEILAGAAGTQLGLIRGALARRVGSVQQPPPDGLVELRFVHSFGGRLLDQLGLAIHPDAKVTRVGVLAPFFEQDDLGGDEDGLVDVLAELLALRPSQDAALDIGVPWDDSPIVAPASRESSSLDEGVGRLWAWRKREPAGDELREVVEYFVVGSVHPKRIQITNSAGEVCRHEREMLEAEISERSLWQITTPTVHAPKNILQRLAGQHPVCLWLHPTTSLAAFGRPRRRPLHAKVFLVTAAYRGRAFTYGLIGSANASRNALARGVAQRGNVEAAVLCRFDGEVSIHDVLPSLVRFSLDGVELVERDAPSGTLDLSGWIEEVVHDAASRTLRVLWQIEGPAPLGEWRLCYVDRELAREAGVPPTPTLIENFDLNAASAEVPFASGGLEWQLPIRITDLAALPPHPSLADIGLRELLALLGRRVSAERLATLRAQRDGARVSNVLDAVFGEGFGPTDVFKAWWGAADDLRLAATVAGFRHRLVGPMGVQTAWHKLRDVPDEVLSQDEVWVYGCELLRELQRVVLPAGPDATTKRELLADVVRELRVDLSALAPSADSHSWMNEVSSFYGIGGRDACANP